jgi:hypothetical protein
MMKSDIGKEGMLSISREDFAAIAGEIVKQGKSFSFRAHGRSMAPFIADGDTIVVSPLERPARIGDVVLLQENDGRMIVHRIVGRKRGLILTRGDACATADAPADHVGIVGRVTAVSGRGYSFHLRKSFGYLNSRKNDYPFSLLWWGPLRKAAKMIAPLLG